MFIVKFTGVGGSIISESTVELDDLNTTTLYRAVRKANPVGTKFIQFTETSKDPPGGSIYIGIFRRIGEWSVVPETPATTKG